MGEFFASAAPVLFGVLGILIVLMVIMSMWKKVPQDKAGVVTGMRKRVVTGGGTLVIPVLERLDVISLENIPLKINTSGAMTSQGVPIEAVSTAVIKIKNEKGSILSAVEQFNTGKEALTLQRIQDTATSVLEGRLREIVGKLTVEEIYKDREAFSEQVRGVADSSLAVMGFELIAFTIKEITDPNGYLKALGAQRIAEVKKDAAIAEAEAEREKKVRLAEANQAGEEARLSAEAAIAQAQKDKEVRQAAYNKEAQTAKARADAAYEIEQNVVRKQIIDTNADAEILSQQRQRDIASEQVQVEVAREQKNIELAQTKADVKRKYLEESVVNPAEAARREAEIKAEADKIKSIKNAEAQAESRVLAANAEAEAEKAKAAADAFKIKSVGEQEAGVIRAKGQAEADVIRLKLEAEAEGMQKKAEAYKQYGDAAVVQMLVEVMPEMAKNIAEPISNIDKVVVWDSGNGGGALKPAENVTRLLASTIDSVKEMTGVDIKSMLGHFTKGKSDEQED